MCHKMDRLSARYYCNAVVIITDVRKTRAHFERSMATVLLDSY